MFISNQKRMAAAIFSKKLGKPVGIHRIWVNPDYLSEVADAVQKDDVRTVSYTHLTLPTSDLV